MHGTRIRLIRAELYEKVWTTPMRTLGEELGLSDVGLAKICRKHDIPLPPVGYWRQEETGHELTRPPLNSAKNGAETLDIFVRERLKPEFATLAAEPTPKITIPAELSHALALRTEKLLAHGKENDKKLMVPKAGTTPHLFVSREQLPRALRILNALFFAIEERGQSVSWPKEESAVLTFAVDGETIKFCLLEVINSVAHVLTPAEQKHTWTAPKWDYQLTGKLKLRIDNLPYGMGPIRSTWSDGKRQRLENCIGHFVVGLNVVATAIKKNRQQIEERDRQWEEERKREEEERQVAEEGKRKAEFVSQLVQNWEEATRLRRFAKSMQESAGQLDLSERGKSDVQRVIDWTNLYADFLDPLADLPQAVSEFVRPEEAYSWLTD
jgi:hypothetical protein